jgi:NADH:ubiquinone oxidoreductase subunit 5 (subunit L)/multisubunit Na+/H+ antiporter MnhA subunit
LLGFGLAWQLYYRNPQLPEKIAASMQGGISNDLLHKYYVDEIYAAFIVKPLIEGSTKILWQGR